MMPEDPMFMADSPSGHHSGSANPNPAHPANNQTTTEYIGLELDPYDLEDPFAAGLNLDVHFSRSFLDATSSTETPFSLDPISISNEFSTHDGSGIDPHNGVDKHNNNDHNNTLSLHFGIDDADSLGLNQDFSHISSPKRESKFDVSQVPFADMNNAMNLGSNSGSEDNDNSNNRYQGSTTGSATGFNGSQGEEQEDPSQQPRRSRATGELLLLLIAEFSKNVNPNGTVRKQLANATGMSERSVRIWFQNRRLKQKKIEKLNKEDRGGSTSSASGRSYSAADTYTYDGSNKLTHGRPQTLNNLQDQAKVPIMINENYYLIDCNSISIGTWQRIKSGYINPQILKNLINLSPKFLNSLMFTTDLLIILSKKNMEMNYFFSGFFQNNKILFRIFYPLEHILSCSLLNQQQQIAQDSKDVTTTLGSELRITLTSPPKFAVFFLNNTTTGRENTNQWSICDDFSEGQQVNNAYIGEGGSDTPHILSGGNHELLKFLNNFVLQYHQLLLLQHLQSPIAQGATSSSNNSDGLNMSHASSDHILSTHTPKNVLDESDPSSSGNPLGNTNSGDLMGAQGLEDFLLDTLGNVGDMGVSDNLLGF